MASHTISVKYIPSTAIDSLNTMISAVPVMDCLFTLHVEAFSCRVSRADKQLFEQQRRDHQIKGNNSGAGSTPNNTYSTSVTPQHRFEDDSDFRFDNDPPPSSQSQKNATFPVLTTFSELGGGGNSGMGMTNVATTPPTTPPMSYMSPPSGGAVPNSNSIAQSGRPCFPEFFALPVSVTGGMGSAQGSGLPASGGGMGTPQTSASSGGGLLLSNVNNNNTNQSSNSGNQQQQPFSYGSQYNNYGAGGGFGGFSLDNDMPMSPVRPLPPTVANVFSVQNNVVNGAGQSFPASQFAPISGAYNNGGATSSSSAGGAGGGTMTTTAMGTAQPSVSSLYVPQSAEEAYALSLHIISDRLVLLVGALNSLYGTADYDFSVLEPKDFILVNPVTFISEVTGILSQLPSALHSYTGQNGEAFWRAIGAMVGGEVSIYDAAANASECDVFLFRCPQCDPAAQTKLWSQHYFVYHKKNKVIISLLAFTEGNLYKQQIHGGGVAGAAVAGGVDGSHLSSAGYGKKGALVGGPTQVSEGEFYIDNDGNTHVIGSDDDDDDIRSGNGSDFYSRGGGGGRGGRGGSGYGSQRQTPTPPYAYGGDGGGDTPHYHASMTEGGQWGGEYS